jgi:hypothetical protein
VASVLPAFKFGVLYWQWITLVSCARSYDTSNSVHDRLPLTKNILLESTPFI